MNELKVTLKQVTPIIHFQADQEGATLRASEVKPKLDKFLQEHFPDEIQESWYLPKVNGKKYRALDYKMQIKSKGKFKEIIPVDKEGNEVDVYLSYFGNIGLKGKERKKIIFNEDGVGLRIIAKSEDLKDLIEKYIDLFFATNNFGTRQSKGFGSFATEKYVSDEEITKIYPKFARLNIESSDYSRRPRITGYANQDRCKHSEIIKAHYKLSESTKLYNLMKSGINGRIRDGEKERTFYQNEDKDFQRGFLRAYYADKAGLTYKKESPEKHTPYSNDKKFIKMHNLGLIKKDKSERFLFLRLMLGLAGNIDFICIASNKREKGKDGNPLPKEKMRIEIYSEFEKTNNPAIDNLPIEEKIYRCRKKDKNFQQKVERFRSMVTIKILEDRVLLLPEKLDELSKNIYKLSSVLPPRIKGTRTPPPDRSRVQYPLVQYYLPE
ncbi:hypothetical protein OfM1_15620 [Lactovum odontotermitis]